MYTAISVGRSGADGEGGGVVAWEAGSGRVTCVLRDTQAPRAVLPLRGSLLLSASRKRPSLAVHAWPKSAPRFRAVLPEKARCLAATGDGRLLFAGGDSGQLACWQLAAGQLLRSWQAHYKAVTAVASSPDDAWLASAGEDALVKLWRLTDVLHSAAARSTDAAAVHSWAEHSLPVTALAFGRGGGRRPRLFTASLDCSAKVLDACSGRVLHSIVCPASLHCLAVDVQELTLFLGGGDGRIFAVNMNAAAAVSVLASRARQPVRTVLKAHSSAVNALALTPDGEMLLSASADATVKVWHAASRQLLRTVTHHDGPVCALTVIPSPAALRGGDALPAPAMTPLRKFVAPAATAATTLTDLYDQLWPAEEEEEAADEEDEDGEEEAGSGRVRSRARKAGKRGRRAAAEDEESSDGDGDGEDDDDDGGEESKGDGFIALGSGADDGEPASDGATGIEAELARLKEENEHWRALTNKLYRSLADKKAGRRKRKTRASGDEDASPFEDDNGDLLLTAPLSAVPSTKPLRSFTRTKKKRRRM